MCFFAEGGQRARVQSKVEVVDEPSVGFFFPAPTPSARRSSSTPRFSFHPDFSTNHNTSFASLLFPILFPPKPPPLHSFSTATLPPPPSSFNVPSAGHVQRQQLRRLRPARRDPPAKETRPQGHQLPPVPPPDPPSLQQLVAASPGRRRSLQIGAGCSGCASVAEPEPGVAGGGRERVLTSGGLPFSGVVAGPRGRDLW